MIRRNPTRIAFFSIIALLLFIDLPAYPYPEEATQVAVPNPPNQYFCHQEYISNVVCELIFFLNQKKIQVQVLAKTKTAARFGYEYILDERWIRTDMGIFEVLVYKKNQETDHTIQIMKEDMPFNEKIHWKILPVTASSNLYIATWKNTKPLFDYLNAFRWQKTNHEAP